MQNLLLSSLKMPYLQSGKDIIQILNLQFVYRAFKWETFNSIYTEPQIFVLDCKEELIHIYWKKTSFDI